MRKCKIFSQQWLSKNNLCFCKTTSDLIFQRWPEIIIDLKITHYQHRAYFPNLFFSEHDLQRKLMFTRRLCISNAVSKSKMSSSNYIKFVNVGFPEIKSNRIINFSVSADGSNSDAKLCFRVKSKQILKSNT